MSRKIFNIAILVLVVLCLSSCMMLPNGDILWFIPVPVPVDDPEPCCPPPRETHYRPSEHDGHHAPDGHRPPPRGPRY